MNLRSITKIVLPVLVLVIAGSLFQHLKASKPERDKPQIKEKVWQVEVIAALKQSLSPELTLYGRIESPELLHAAAPGGGIVSAVRVRSGTKVKRGDLLVKMDPRDFELALVQARSSLDEVENQISELKIRHRSNLSALKTEHELLQLADDDVQRMQQLLKQKLGSNVSLSDARSALGRQRLSVISREYEVESFAVQLSKLESLQQHNQARLSDTQLMIERSEVKAPFDAIVSATPVSAGDRVATGQTLVSLYPVDGLEIRAHIPARYVPDIQLAIRQNLRLQARISLADANLALPLKRLAGEAEASGIDAFFQAGETGRDLRPGALIPLNFSLPLQPDAIAIPFQAIYGNSRLYLLRDDRLKGIDVETLGQYRNAEGSTLLLVRSKLINTDDSIVVTHLPNAVSGLKVKPTQNATSQ